MYHPQPLNLPSLPNLRPAIEVRMDTGIYPLTLTFRYDAAHVEAIKQAIPYADRQWDSAEKCWRIKLGAWDALFAKLGDWLSIDYEVWCWLYPAHEPEPVAFVPSPRRVPQKQYGRTYGRSR